MAKIKVLVENKPKGNIGVDSEEYGMIKRANLLA